MLPCALGQTYSLQRPHWLGTCPIRELIKHAMVMSSDTWHGGNGGTCDYTSRHNFFQVADETEQGVIKVLVSFLRDSQQSPRLTIPDFMFEGPQDNSTLRGLLRIFKASCGFHHLLRVPPGNGFSEVQLNFECHLGADAKRVFILSRYAVSGSFGCTLCSWLALCSWSLLVPFVVCFDVAFLSFVLPFPLRMEMTLFFAILDAELIIYKLATNTGVMASVASSVQTSA
jgi:hypothetical protein